MGVSDPFFYKYENFSQRRKRFEGHGLLSFMRLKYGKETIGSRQAGCLSRKE